MKIDGTFRPYSSLRTPVTVARSCSLRQAVPCRDLRGVIPHPLRGIGQPRAARGRAPSRKHDAIESWAR